MNSSITNQIHEFIHQYTLLPKLVISTSMTIFAFIFIYKLYNFFFTCRVVLFHGTESVEVEYNEKDTTKKTTLLELLKAKCPLLTDPKKNIFHVYPLLLSGHLQTVWTSLYGVYFFKQKVQYNREFIDTPDGGIISLDWTQLPDSKKSTPTPYVFITHGLTGGSQEAYVQELIVVVKEYGYRAVVMNFRGCSETPVKSAQLYSGASVADLELSVNHLMTRDPTAVVFGVGFSLGSNVLLKYAGQLGKNCPMIGCVSIGNPYDVLGSFRALDRTFMGKNYSTQMGLNFKNVFEKHSHAFKDADWLDTQEMSAVRTIMDFDAAATSKSFGYKTVHEYYRFCSCAFDIPYIEIPTLLLTALDDPIVTCEVIPYFEVNSNPHVILATTSLGGHLGFFSNKSMLPTERWFPKPIGEFVHAIIDAQLSLDLNKKSKPEHTGHTGTPWYSIPSKVKTDREELLQRKTSICESCDPKISAENSMPTEIVVKTDLKVVKRGMFRLEMLRFLFSLDGRNVFFFILGYALKNLRKLNQIN